MEGIIFNLNQDNRPLKEDITMSSLEVSPFREQYKKSLSEIESYLNALNEDDIDKDMDYANNVFAFSGDRGSGKTSCMISVGGFLSKVKSTRSEFKEKYPNISETNFFSLDLMDPSYFDSKHNILSLFLAKLYGAYQKFTRQRMDIKESKKMEFLTSLTKAQKHAHLLIDAESDVLITNKVEELECLSVAVDLKEDIKELVNNFLECLNFDYKILLLRIDDIDLNAKEAALMAELIRKYFILPNVLVLMALKMNQLDIIKKNEYSNLFALDNSDEQVVDMAERYLTKLFPHSQRVYMPDIEDLLNRKLTITSHNKRKEYPSVQQCVPDLIYQKTRYLFYNSPVHASYIVPRNLRDLRQIIKLLWNMDDYNYSKGNDFHILQTCKYNQALFKKYLAEIWINNNLSITQQNFAHQILYTEELMYLNYYVVKELSTTSYINDDVIRACCNDDNSVYNISLGDVLGIIEFLYRKTNDIKKQKFLFFIKTVYSIQLHESYDKIMGAKNNLLKDYSLDNYSSQSSKEIFRNSQYSNIEDFEKLVKGSYVNVKIQPLLPPDMALDNRLLKGEEFYNLMTNCAADFEIVKKGKLIQLLEFFMLATFYSKNQDVDYRKREIVVYDVPIHKNEELIFDLGAFFFNLTRIERCYNRFRGIVFVSDGRDLIDCILSCNHSLYRDFMYFAKSNYAYNCSEYNKEFCESEKSDYKRWLSFCTIRNIEILQDFLKTIQKIEIDRSKAAREKLAKFFEKCSTYTISTYDLDIESKCYNNIHFKFLNNVAKLLNDENIDSWFVRIFGEKPQMIKSILVEDPF